VRRAINMTPSDDGSRLDLVARLVRADREHIHHRLVASGLSHRAAVVLLYAVGAGLAALAVAVTAR
jgi:UDP-N-acetylmuramyl pentapeptide phosphotransferase/UDP-N-acetylglucosamine-1-phosphate transferase